MLEGQYIDQILVATSLAAIGCGVFVLVHLD